MADFSNDAWLWATRVLGASAGAAVSLVYLVPKSRREAASRFFTGLACGTIFGTPTGIWIAEQLALADRLSVSEVILSGSAASSLCAWWGLASSRASPDATAHAFAREISAKSAQRFCVRKCPTANFRQRGV